MTDGKGCVAALGKKGYRIAGKKTLLVGAGGAGVAVADALVEAGVEELCIYDKNGRAQPILRQQFKTIPRNIHQNDRYTTTKSRKI